MCLPFCTFRFRSVYQQVSEIDYIQFEFKCFYLELFRFNFPSSLYLISKDSFCNLPLFFTRYIQKTKQAIRKKMQNICNESGNLYAQLKNSLHIGSCFDRNANNEETMRRKKSQETSTKKAIEKQYKKSLQKEEDQCVKRKEKGKVQLHPPKSTCKSHMSSQEQKEQLKDNLLSVFMQKQNRNTQIDGLRTEQIEQMDRGEQMDKMEQVQRSEDENQIGKNCDNVCGQQTATAVGSVTCPSVSIINLQNQSVKLTPFQLKRRKIKTTAKNHGKAIATQESGGKMDGGQGWGWFGKDKGGKEERDGKDGGGGGQGGRTKETAKVKQVIAKESYNGHQFKGFYSTTNRKTSDEDSAFKSQPLSKNKSHSNSSIVKSKEIKMMSFFHGVEQDSLNDGLYYDGENEPNGGLKKNNKNAKDLNSYFQNLLQQSNNSGVIEGGKEKNNGSASELNFRQKNKMMGSGKRGKRQEGDAEKQRIKKCFRKCEVENESDHYPRPRTQQSEKKVCSGKANMKFDRIHAKALKRERQDNDSGNQNGKATEQNWHSCNGGQHYENKLMLSQKNKDQLGCEIEGSNKSGKQSYAFFMKQSIIPSKLRTKSSKSKSFDFRKNILKNTNFQYFVYEYKSIGEIIKGRSTSAANSLPQPNFFKKKKNRDISGLGCFLEDRKRNLTSFEEMVKETKIYVPIRPSTAIAKNDPSSREKPKKFIRSQKLSKSVDVQENFVRPWQDTIGFDEFI